MFNVDTILLGTNFEERQTEVEMLTGRTRRMTDYKYVNAVNEKIKNKLYLDDNNKKKLRKVIELKQMAKNSHHILTRKDLTRDLDIKRYGSDGGYSFYYNETRHTLSVHLQHWLVEDFTSEEIINNTKQELTNYFGLTAEELEPLTLRRIDYYCDYKFRDEMELEIIKNIIIKITDQFYTYKKEITDKPSKYVVKYLALKNGSEKLSVENLTVIDKEVDDDYEV